MNGDAGRLINVSVSGALLRTSQVLPVGQRVSLWLAGGTQSLFLEAAVRRVASNGANDQSIAVEFVDMSGFDKRAIPRIVAASF